MFSQYHTGDFGRGLKHVGQTEDPKDTPSTWGHTGGPGPPGPRDVVHKCQGRWSLATSPRLFNFLVRLK